MKLANRMLLEAAVDAAEHDQARARELAAEAVSIAPWGGNSGSGIDGTTVVPPPAADAPGPGADLRPADARLRLRRGRRLRGRRRTVPQRVRHP